MSRADCLRGALEVAVEGIGDGERKGVVDLANRTSCYGAGPNNDDRSALSLGEITVPGGSVFRAFFLSSRVAETRVRSPPAEGGGIRFSGERMFLVAFFWPHFSVASEK